MPTNCNFVILFFEDVKVLDVCRAFEGRPQDAMVPAPSD